MPEPEFIELTEDDSGDVEWLDAPETLEEHGSRPRRSRRRLVLTAIATVAVLAATTLILRANHVIGPSPDSRAVGTVDWRKTLPEVGLGMWTTSDSVIIATGSGLTAYSLSHGTKLWSWAVPTGDEVCAMTPSTSQGRGVVAFGPLSPPIPNTNTEAVCTAAQAINIATGKAAWSAPAGLASGSESVSAYTAVKELSISGSYVVAPYGMSGIASIDAATGARLWTSDQLPDPRPSGLGGCLDLTAQTLDGNIYTLAVDVCDTPNTSIPSVAVYSASKIGSPQVLTLPADTPRCPAEARALFATSADVLVTCMKFNGLSFPAYAITPGVAELVPLELQPIGGVAPAVVSDTADQLELVGGYVTGNELIVEQPSVSSITALTDVDLATGLAQWRHAFPSGSRFYPLDGTSGVQVAGNVWTLFSIDPTTRATTTTPLDAEALAASGLNGSYDHAVIGSTVVTAEFGPQTTLVVSTL